MNKTLYSLALGVGLGLGSCAGTSNIEPKEASGVPTLYTTIVTPPQYVGKTLDVFKSGDRTFSVTGVASTKDNPLRSLEVLVINGDGTIGTLYVDGFDRKGKQVPLDCTLDGAYAHDHELTGAPVFIDAEDLKFLNLPSYEAASKALEEAIKKEQEATNPRIPLEKFLKKRTPSK